MKYEVECKACQVFIDQYHELERLILKFGKWRANWFKRQWYKLFDPDYQQDVDRMQNLMISMMMNSYHFVRHYERMSERIEFSDQELIHLYDWYNEPEHLEESDQCETCEKIDIRVQEMEF